VSAGLRSRTFMTDTTSPQETDVGPEASSPEGMIAASGDPPP
jgi:hypothetical protein